MRKVFIVFVLLLIFSGCSNDTDKENELRSRIDRLNNKVMYESYDYTFDSDSFGEFEKYQFMSWINNSKKEDSFVRIENQSNEYILSYVDHMYRYSLRDQMGNDYHEFMYDIVVFDTRSNSFILYSSLLNAPSIELISLSK